MKRALLAALLSSLCVPALAQFVFGPGNYTTSISGTTFVHNGGAIPGLSTGEVATCGSSHIHGAIGAVGDPGGTCGHGTPIFVSALSATSSGSTSNSAASMLAASDSNANPLNNTAGVLASRPIDPAAAGELFLLAAIGFGAGGDPDALKRNPRALPTNFVRDNPRLMDVLTGGTGGGERFEKAQADLAANEKEEADRASFERLRADMNMIHYGTPNPTLEQEAKGPNWNAAGVLRDDAPKPPPAPPASNPSPAAPPAANPPPAAGSDGQSASSVLTTLEEPNYAQMARKPDPAPAAKPAAEPVDSEMEKFQDRAAQDIVDGLFSGNESSGKAAASALGNAPREVQNRVTRKIVERIQKTVDEARRAMTNAAAGPPRALN